MALVVANHERLGSIIFQHPFSPICMKRPQTTEQHERAARPLPGSVGQYEVELTTDTMKELFDAELLVLKEVTAGENRQWVDTEHRSQLTDFFKRGAFEASFQGTEVGSAADL